MYQFTVKMAVVAGVHCLISKVESEGQILYTAFIKDVTQQYYEKEKLRLLSLVTDQTDSAIIITDGQWKIIYVNAGFEKVFGYTAKEVEGLHPTALLTPNLSQTSIAKVHEKLLNGLPVKSEELTHVKSGERIWSSITVNPILDDHNSSTHTVSILSDITGAKCMKLCNIAFSMRWPEKSLLRT